MTRAIAWWAHQHRDDEGRYVFAGVRYLSRLDDAWECWAVFDDVEIEDLSRQPILREDHTLLRVANQYGIRVLTAYGALGVAKGLPERNWQFDGNCHDTTKAPCLRGPLGWAVQESNLQPWD
jgi:hypothetical protein